MYIISLLFTSVALIYNLKYKVRFTRQQSKYFYFACMIVCALIACISAVHITPSLDFGQMFIRSLLFEAICIIFLSNL